MSIGRQKNLTSVIAILILISACSLRKAQPRANSNQEKRAVLAKQENARYKLTAIFYGTSWKDGSGPFDHIAIRNDSTGEEFVYEPTEPFNKNNIWNVWSPDGEFLMLMRGDVKGICIIKANEAEREIKSHSCSDFIMVYPKSTPTGLMHSYGIWRGNDEFLFSAGLSGDSWDFTYNIRTRELKVKGSERNFEGENRYGKVSLSDSPDG